VAGPQREDPEALQGDDADVTDDGAGGPDDVYNPSAVQVTRGREQGLGVGARDLQMQGDPTGGDDETEAERLMRATAPKSPSTGLPDTEAQKTPAAEPTYPAIDGDDAETAGDSQPDGNRRA
jgi:hypothetical protein